MKYRVPLRGLNIFYTGYPVVILPPYLEMGESVENSCRVKSVMIRKGTADSLQIFHNHPTSWGMERGEVLKS